MGRRMKRLFVTFVLLCGAIGCGSAPPQVSTAPVTSPSVALAPPSGGGGLAVSPEVAALWLSRAVRVGEPLQPLVMAFYKGTPGWHEKQWKIADDYGNPPSFIKMVSPELTVSLAESAEGIVRVQGKVVDLSLANVFLVRRIDGPATAVQVVPVGFLRLPIPPEAIPPLFVLEAQPEIAAQVHGNSLR